MAASGTPLKDLYEKYGEDINYILLEMQVYLKMEENEMLIFTAKEFPIDELCALKFLLSAQRKKDPCEAALENLKLALRERFKRRDVLLKVGQLKSFRTYLPTTLGGFLGSEFIFVNHIGKANLHDIAKKCDNNIEKIATLGICGAEQLRLILDKESRETGRLCKMLTVLDLQGLSMSKSMNMTMIKAMGVVSKFNDVCNPQLLSRIVIFQPPFIFSSLLSIGKPFFSKATMEKMSVCGVKKISGKTVAECPFIAKYVNGAASIPMSIGGSLDGVELEVSGEF
jgi:hypothetical protein